MAAAIGESGGPKRVFVLVDKGEPQGVFLSWDAAENYADLHHLTLDHLQEYVTRHDHPDHLHLLSAQWEGDWDFYGEWKRETPRWKRPPDRVRLDHYHLKREAATLIRSKEFNWSTGLLLKIDPMAPDPILDQVGSQKQVSPAKQWRPKLGALKSPSSTASPTAKPQLPEGFKERVPLITEPEPPLDDALPTDTSASPEPDKPVVKPVLDRSPVIKPKLATDKPKPPPQSGVLPIDEKPKISFPSRKPLKLKDRHIPKPIPEFGSVATPPAMVSVSSSVETEQTNVHPEQTDKDADSDRAKTRRVYPKRLIIAVLAVIIGWGGGTFWVFRPQPTAQEIISSSVTLNRATVVAIEPGQVFFQLPIDPIYQQRYVQSLGMEAIPGGTVFTVPTHHALVSWSKTEGFVRPPYAEVEVREWWNLRIRKVQYGFTLSWDDGSILLLDLESDMLIGWMRAKHINSVLN